MCGIQNFAQSYKDHQEGKVKIRTPLRVKLALVALILIGPTSRVVLVRLEANPEHSCIYIICFRQVQTCLNVINRNR